MEIRTVRNGKQVTVVYGEGQDNNCLQSKEPPAPEFKQAFENLALDYKTILANQLGVNPAKIEGFIQDHHVQFDKIHFVYNEDEETPASYDVWGHHEIVSTGYSTPIQLSFLFGQEGSPDKAALAIIREAREYAGGRRAQMTLWESAEEADKARKAQAGDKDPAGDTPEAV